MAQSVTFNINLKLNGEEVVRKITVNVDELKNAIEATKSTSQKLTESFLKYNQCAEAIGTVSDSVSQLANTLNSLTEEIRTFSGAMAAANTMAGKSGEDFEKLKDQVTELSKTIPVARDELANGLYQVISNGVPEDNWIEYLEKSAKASVGGIADLGETVKVTSTVIKNYGLEWDAVGEIQDKIQLTAKNGVTSFEQMAQALPRVTAQASTLGVSVDELMASFATLTGVSGNTAEVSTQLAAIFTALIKPSSEATEMAQQMGIQFDAAAIQAAGGMSDFIVQLDKDVKRFAKSSGMLEQEIYGKLFGSAESLRALTPLTGKLADKFKENIDAMAGSTGTINDAFDTMANTGKAKLQLLNNKLGEVSDTLQNTVGNALPYLNFSSQVLVSMAALSQLGISIKSIASALNITTAATNVAKAASVALNNTRVSGVAVARVLTPAYRGEAVGATTAAVATRALKVAIKGLMISTGVGIAVWALTEAVGYLASSSDDATEKVDNLKEAEDAATNASAQVKVEIDAEVKKLGELIQAKQDTTEAVKNLNAKYGDIFGSHKKASEWYDILTKKSKTYIKQIGYEAQAKVLASKLAEKEIELENNYGKRRDLWKSGGAVTTSKRTVTDRAHGETYEVVTQKDTDAYAALKDEARGLIPEIEELKRKLGIVEGKMKEVAVEMQNIGETTTSTLKVSDMNWSQTEKAIEDTVSKMKNTTDKATIAKLQAYKKQLEARQKTLKGMGVSTETGDLTKTKKTKTEPKFYKDPKTEQELSKNINYYEGKLTGQDTAEQRAIIKNIQLWKQKRQEIELAKKAALVPAELKTTEDVNAKLDYLNAKKNVAKPEELQVITRQISETELKGLELQRPGNLTADSSDEDIDREIAYQQKLKATSEGATDAIDKEIKRLERLKDKRTELQIMQDALSDVQEEFDNATTVEAKVEANARITDLQKQIDEATRGKLTIEAEPEPTYIVQGSAADKRQSYSNAQSKASLVKSDYDMGIIDKDEAERQIKALNDELAQLGAHIKPIKVEIDTGEAEKAIGGLGSVSLSSYDSVKENLKALNELPAGTAKGFAAAGDAAVMLGGAMQQLGADSEAAKVGMVLAAVGQIVLSFAQALASCSTWVEWLAFGIAGTAQMISIISTVSQFATGGIVPGTSYTGDKVIARVNSGEMILNSQQQARLFAIANGAAVYGEALAVGGEWQDGMKPQEVKAQLQKLQRLAVEGQTATEQNIRLRVRGRDLIQASGNELRSTRKRSNLR